MRRASLEQRIRLPLSGAEMEERCGHAAALHGNESLPEAAPAPGAQYLGEPSRQMAQLTKTVSPIVPVLGMLTETITPGADKSWDRPQW